MPKSKRPKSAVYKVKSYVTETILRNGSAAFFRAIERKYNSTAVQAHRVSFRNSEPHQCYRNCVAYIKQHGGSLVHCWMLCRSHKAHLRGGQCEAIEHFVVRTADGRYVDPTPINTEQHTDVVVPTNLHVPLGDAYSFGGNLSWYRGSLNASVFPSNTLLYLPRDSEIIDLYLSGFWSTDDLITPLIWHDNLMQPHLNVRFTNKVGETV